MLQHCENISYLEQVPIEVLMKILEDASFNDIKNLSQTNKALHTMLTNNKFWQEKLKIYYPNEYKNLKNSTTLSDKFYYDHFKWCFNQGFYVEGEIISKEKNKNLWKSYHQFY